MGLRPLPIADPDRLLDRRPPVTPPEPPPDAAGADPPFEDRAADDRAAGIRAAGRAARRALTGADRRAAEAAIVGRLLRLEALRGPGRLSLSRSTDGEADLTGAVGALRGRGGEVHLPVVGPDRSMAFRPWHLGDVLVAGPFGVEVPPRAGREDRLAAELDVVVLPCTAVDLHGHRLGFGAGYYDRALAPDRLGDAPAPLTVGVVFDVQVAADLPVRAWDVPVDVVVTDRRVVRTRSAG